MIDLVVIAAIVLGLIIALALWVGKPTKSRCPKCGKVVVSDIQQGKFVKTVNYYCHKCGWSG